MDIDIVEENEQQLQPEPVKVTGKRPANLPVDEAHPFDLEAYISSYKGPWLSVRLSVLIPLCSLLSLRAFQDVRTWTVWCR